VLLLQKTVRVKNTILEKVYTTLEDPGKKLDTAVTPLTIHHPHIERCRWCSTRSRLKGLEVAPPSATNSLSNLSTSPFLIYETKGEDETWELSLMYRDLVLFAIQSC